MSIQLLLLLLILVENSLLLPLSLGNTLISKNHSSRSLREKRFVIFPEGSSFSCSISQSVHLIGYPTMKCTEGWNIHTVFDLPNNETLQMQRHAPRALLMRKKRSSFYKNLQTVLNMNQIDGQACIYRILCETSQRLTNSQTFFHALLNVLFHFPTDDITNSESTLHRRYISARNWGLEGGNCEELYSNCPFSILNFQLQLF